MRGLIISLWCKASRKPGLAAQVPTHLTEGSSASATVHSRTPAAGFSRVREGVPCSPYLQQQCKQASRCGVHCECHNILGDGNTGLLKTENRFGAQNTRASRKGDCLRKELFGMASNSSVRNKNRGLERLETNREPSSKQTAGLKAGFLLPSSDRK